MAYKRPSAPNFIQAISSPTQRTFQPGKLGGTADFARLADENPLYGELSQCFREVDGVMGKMYQTLGGWWRDERAQRLLAQRQVREKLCGLIDAAKAADTRAYALLKRLAGEA